MWKDIHRLNNHFIFECEGKKYCFVNIRKNACSSFRRFIHKVDPRGPEDSDLAFRHFRVHYAAADLSEVVSCDERIVILRDPIQRLVSAYVNKFVARVGNEDIFNNYRGTTGKDPEQATIDDFVDYVCAAAGKLDAHVVPQSQQLMPLEYTSVFLMKNLPAAAVQLFGDSLGQHFAKRVNSTPPKFERPTLSDASMGKLEAFYQRDMELVRLVSESSAIRTQIDGAALYRNQV